MGVAKAPCCCCHCLCCLASPILCCLFSVVLSIIVVLGGAVLVLYFLLDPKVPSIALVQQQVSSFNASSFNAGQQNVSEVSGAFQLTFEFHNPNRVGLRYSNATLLLSYPTPPLLLSNFTMPSFQQGAGDTRNVSVSTSFSTSLPTSTAPTFLFQYQNGSLPLHLEVRIDGAINIWGITSPSTGVVISCDLEMAVYSQTITGTQCKKTSSYIS